MLIGVVAFGVWSSMSMVAFGVWASSRAAATVSHPQRAVASSPAFTPQGWALPLHVVRLPEAPADETERLDRLRLLWARAAVGFSCLALLVDLLFGISHERSLGVITAILIAYGVLLGFGVLWWTVQSASRRAQADP